VRLRGGGGVAVLVVQLLSCVSSTRVSVTAPVSTIEPPLSPTEVDGEAGEQLTISTDSATTNTAAWHRPRLHIRESIDASPLTWGCRTSRAGRQGTAGAHPLHQASIRQ
jgi:hypothetical protein